MTDAGKLALQQTFFTEEVLGVPSSRPELRVPSSSFLQEYEDQHHQVWKRNLQTHMKQCDQVIFAEGRCCEALAECGFSSPQTPYLFHLEKTLLDLSSPSLTDGVFFCSLFKVDTLYYCRFFESGVLSGYFLSEGLDILKCHLEGTADDLALNKVIWSQVFNDEDVQQYYQRYTKNLERKRSHQSLSNPLTDVGRRYTNLLKKNKTGVINSLKNLMAKAQTQQPSDACKLIGTCVQVIKHNSHKEKDSLQGRFFEASIQFYSHAHTWENSMKNFRTDGTPLQPLKFVSLLKNPASSRFTWHDQCNIISSIPNNHYWKEGAHAHVGYNRMLSIRDETGKYKPASLRNAILLNYREENLSPFFHLVNKYLNPDSDEVPSKSKCFAADSCTNDSVDIPSERRARICRRALTEQDILRNLHHLNPHFSAENRSTENSSFLQYKTAQIESGKLFWRIHVPDMDVIAMNDVNMNTGLFSVDSYIHMCRTVEAGEARYSCSCSLYSTLLQLATLNEPETDVVAVDIRCCHIRFFVDIIAPFLEQYFIQNSFNNPSKIQKKVLDSTIYVGQQVCCLSSTSKTSKFSVISPGNIDCKFVHLYNKRLSCKSGECQALYGYSQRKVIYLDSTTNVCPHLEALKQHPELWQKDLDDISAEDEGCDDEHEIHVDDEDLDERSVEVITGDIQSNTQDEFFNTETGLWDFPSLSQHCPKEEKDRFLQQSIHQRLAIFDGADGVSRDTDGCMIHGNFFVLFPPVNETRCSCGAGYISNEHPDGVLSDVKFRPVIYLTNGPARFMVCNRECLDKNPQCTITYCGSTDSLHFLSKETGAGDEIGWDFVQHALNSHITFSAFCKIMTNRYQRSHCSSCFMSPQTFISWWFSWSSKFKIDFRQPCHICKHNPKFLACDGTKIVINFRHADVVPIEHPTTNVLIDPCHRRNARAFLYFDQSNPVLSEKIVQCRDHLLYLARKSLGLLKENEILPLDSETSSSVMLLEMVDNECSCIIRKFICKEYPSLLLKRLATVLKILSTCPLLYLSVI